MDDFDNIDITKDIPYIGDGDALQTLDIYVPKQTSENHVSRLVVYVHGGAWRSGDKSHHGMTFCAPLAQQLNMPVASINYRLSATVPGQGLNKATHPDHENDVHAALQFLASTSLSKRRWQTNNMIAIGHSCGSFLVFNSSPLILERTKTPVQDIVLVSGIFGLEALLEEYPTYQDFVTGAFPDQSTWSQVSPLTRSLSNTFSTTRILIVHTKSDSLLSIKQPLLMKERLVKAGIETLSVDTTSVDGDHFEILEKSQDLRQVIVPWVQNL